MLLVSGLKKLASVVRAGGMGKYIWVESGSSRPVSRAAKLKSWTSPFISIMVERRPSACSYW